MFPLVAQNKKFLSSLKQIEDQWSFNGLSFVDDTVKFPEERNESSLFPPRRRLLRKTKAKTSKRNMLSNALDERLVIDNLFRRFGEITIDSEFMEYIRNSVTDSRQLSEVEYDAVRYLFALFIRTNDELMEPFIKPYPIEDHSRSYMASEDTQSRSIDFSQEIELAAEIEDQSQDIPETVIGVEPSTSTMQPKKEKGVKKVWYLHKSKYCDNIQQYRKGKFYYSNSKFFKEPVLNDKQKIIGYQPRSEVILNVKDFDTLCHINSVSTSANLRWSDVESLIRSLGGNIQPISGSKNNVWIPTQWSFPFVLDRNHGARLERNVGKAVYVLFRKWGIQIGRFKYVSE